jgi:hypothetical protein
VAAPTMATISAVLSTAGIKYIYLYYAERTIIRELGCHEQPARVRTEVHWPRPSLHTSSRRTCDGRTGNLGRVCAVRLQCGSNACRCRSGTTRLHTHASRLREASWLMKRGGREVPLSSSSLLSCSLVLSSSSLLLSWSVSPTTRKAQAGRVSTGGSCEHRQVAIEIGKWRLR